MNSRIKILQKLVVYSCERDYCKQIVEEEKTITYFCVLENNPKYFCSERCLQLYKEKIELLRELELFLRLATTFCRPEKAEFFLKRGLTNRSTYFYHDYNQLKNEITTYLGFVPDKLDFAGFIRSTLFINTSKMIGTLISEAKSSESCMPDKHFLLSFSNYLNNKLTELGKLELAKPFSSFSIKLQHA